MRITKVRLNNRAVSIEYVSNNETHSLTSRDVPLPSFVEAIAALKPLVLSILHLPASYGAPVKDEKEGKETPTLTVTGLTMAEKQEVDLVCIVARKTLTDAHSPFNIATPLRFLDHPDAEGSYSPALTDKECGAVYAVIEEAKRYVKGERAQGQLPLGDEKDEEAGAQAEPAAGDLLEYGKR